MTLTEQITAVEAEIAAAKALVHGLSRKRRRLKMRLRYRRDKEFRAKQVIKSKRYAAIKRSLANEYRSEIPAEATLRENGSVANIF